MEFEIENFNALGMALHRMCETLFAENVPEDTVFDTKLVANELLSNALQHGGGAARLKAVLCGNEIRISVKSATPYRPPERSVCSPVTAERGRGLFLVDAIGSSRRYSEQEGVCVVLLIRK